MQSPRLRLRDFVATRNHQQITIANIQSWRSLAVDTPAPFEALGPRRRPAALCPPYSLHPPPPFKLSFEARAPFNPPNPASQSKKRHNRPKVTALSLAQGPAPGTGPVIGSFFPSKGKIYKLTTALPRRPKRVGWVISSLPWATVL